MRLSAGLPIVTFSVPTPSTPHSILSPGESAATPAGVPVMMMSPAPSATCCDSLPDDLRHAPDQFGEVALLPFGAVDRKPDLALRRDGRSSRPAAARRQGAEWSNDLPISHGRSFLRAACCRSRRVRSMPTRIAVDVIERLVGGNVEAAALHRHDQFDLVMQILGQRRIGNGGAIRLEHVGVLGEEERRRALVIAHLADVLEIVAADAPDAANRK